MCPLARDRGIAWLAACAPLVASRPLGEIEVKKPGVEVYVPCAHPQEVRGESSVPIHTRAYHARAIDYLQPTLRFGFRPRLMRPIRERQSGL
jgi:hypothetical protein